jgi:RHS repeat-associated protein
MTVRRATLAFLLCIPALPTFAAEAPSEPRSDWTATQTLWDSGPYDYDGAGYVTSIGTDIYRYDKVGRLKSATADTVPPPPGQLPVNQQKFDYDRYGNLVSMHVATAQETKRYDFAVDKDTNQLNLECETANACFTGFYDAATGSQLGRANAGEYVWDSLGLLAELHTSRSERYVYDAEGERILVIDGVTGDERYTLRNPADKVVRELSRTRATDTWRLNKDYVYRGATLVASFSGARTAPDRHYHLDHLRSTRLVTDGTGHRLAIHTYWPFGPEAAGSETGAERLKFTGHERDSSPATSPGLDLDYMHARYYDANAGRFLSVDPGGADPKTPLSWNRYAYTMDNPVNNTDPDGRETNPVTGQSFILDSQILNSATNRRKGHFGMVRTYPDGTPKKHGGNDIAAPRGTPVFSPISGTVIQSAWAGGDGGYVLRIRRDTKENGQNVYVHISHLNKAPNVKVGDKVVEGQPNIAEVGNTGNAKHEPPHAHTAVMVGGQAKDDQVDPQKWFQDHPSSAEEKKTPKDKCEGNKDC